MRRSASILAALIAFAPFVSMAQSAPAQVVPDCPSLYICVGATTAPSPTAVVNTRGDIAIGFGSGAGDFSLNAYNQSSSAIAVGNYAQAFGMQSIATGTNALADGNDTVAIGAFAHAGNGDYGYDIVDGYVIPHPGEQVAVGYGATATGDSATAVGAGSIATGDVSTATGIVAQATGYAASAYGNNAQAFGDESTSIGTGSFATGANATALGVGAGATGGFSVAIGANSIADQDSTVSVGNSGIGYFRRVVNMADGIDGHDATTVEQIAPLAAYLGGSASFSGGVWSAPTYVLKNPYAPGVFHSVGDALSALDTALSAINPVRYDDGSLSSVTLGGQPSDESNSDHDQSADQTSGGSDTSGSPVTIHNLAPGIAGTDAANVDQVQEAITTANSYTDLRAAQTLNQANSYTDIKSQETLMSANAYTDWRVGALNDKINAARAAAAAEANLVGTFAGADPRSPNRMAAAIGNYGNRNAMAIGYQHVAVDSRNRWTVNATMTMDSAGRSSVGAGVGFSW